MFPDTAHHVQERVRVLHGELLLAACLIHPVPRVVDALALGLASKSNRTRVACTDARSRPFHLIAQVVTPLIFTI